MRFGLKESVIDRVTAVLGRYPQVKQAMLPYSFDISLYSQINDPDLRDHIRPGGAPLYQSDSALTGQTAQSLHPKSG